QYGQVIAFLLKKQINHRLRGKDSEFLRAELTRLAQYFPQDFVAERARRAYAAPRLTRGTGLTQLVCQRIAGTFAGHFDQPQLAETAHRDARAVARERLIELGEHRLSVLGIFHVDKVENHNAAEVAQAQLA